MKLKERISIEEIDGAIFKVRLIESIDNGKAAFTHYAHNQKNGVSKYFKKSAINYIKQILENKYPDDNITNVVAENELQYLIFNYKKNNIPFPEPLTPDFQFIDLFAGIGGFRIALQNINGKCVFSSEWDEQSQKTYEANFGEKPFGDISVTQRLQI